MAKKSSESKAKFVELEQRRYKISEACEVLKVPEKTLQGAVTRRDMEKRGFKNYLLPKKVKGVWYIPSKGLVKWFNEMWRSRPEDVHATLMTPSMG